MFSSEKVFEAEFEGKIIYFRFDQNQNILLYQYKKSKLWKVVRIRKAFCSSLDYMPSGQVSLAYEHFGILTEVRSEISPFSKVVSASEKNKQSNLSATICSPLTGVVLKVISRPGQEVVKGETLMIIEAMKMENRIAAPESGVLAQIDVKEEAPFKLGQVWFRYIFQVCKYMKLIIFFSY